MGDGGGLGHQLADGVGDGARQGGGDQRGEDGARERQAQDRELGLAGGRLHGGLGLADEEQADELAVVAEQGGERAHVLVLAEANDLLGDLARLADLVDDRERQLALEAGAAVGADGLGEPVADAGVAAGDADLEARDALDLIHEGAVEPRADHDGAHDAIADLHGGDAADGEPLLTHGLDALDRLVGERELDARADELGDLLGDAALLDGEAVGVEHADDAVLGQEVQEVVHRHVGAAAGRVGAAAGRGPRGHEAQGLGVARDHLGRGERVLREVVEGVKGDGHVVVEALAGLRLEALGGHDRRDQGDQHQQRQADQGEDPGQLDGDVDTHG
ncbi:hypothetical protein D3C86_1333180 [compost metagenome]